MAKKGLNATRMKERNYARFIRELRLKQATRAQIARVMGLTRSATSIIAEELISTGIVSEVSFSHNEERKTKELSWNKEYSYSAGVSLGRENIYIGLCDFCGNVIDSLRIQTADCVAGEETIKLIGNTILQMIKKNKPAGKFLGVGVAAPGPLDEHTGVVLDPPEFDLIHDIPVAELLRDILHCDIALENDANALALAECCYGIQNRYERFLELFVDMGVGASLILDGKLVAGPSGLGNGFGHTSIIIDGLSCPCGNEGCLEMYAAIPHIVNAAIKIDPTLTSWQIITDQAYLGDSAALDVISSQARYLASMIVTARNALDIQAVILTGETILYRPTLLMMEIEKEVNRRIASRSAQRIEIIPSQIIGNAMLISSVNLVIERFMNQPFVFMKEGRLPCAS